jgi:hypothetical protein
MGIVDCKTWASSLSRCGRLPVFSSCSITATTIVSSMPSVSTFVCAACPPGDGGGVCAAARLALWGVSSNRRVNGRDGLFDVGVEALETEPDECARFTFFAGGECRWLSVVEGGERADRGPPGNAMPSDGRDSDLRRVLYGIVCRANVATKESMGWTRCLVG